jgi:heme/copper-type cytochrome/quinol oxidase subunit 4
MAHDQAHGTAVAHGAYEEHAHPGERTYVLVALILAIVTAVEVAIYYIEAVEDILVPTLLLLSAGKFVAVVGYFMHLKFDDRRFRWIFIFGLAVALACYLGAAAMFIFHGWDVI